MSKTDALPPGAWQHTCMEPGDEATCPGCQAKAAETDVLEHPMVDAVRAYLENGGITPETLRYAATHEALCRSWIFDLLTNLAVVLEQSTPPGSASNPLG